MSEKMKAILVTSEAAPVVVELPVNDEEGGKTLAELQRILVGHIEALPFPYREDATVYIDEEGKFAKRPNPAATALMLPNLFPGDAIYGPMLICGFDAAKGATITVPEDIIEQYVTKFPPATPVEPEAADMGGSDGLR